MIRHEQTIPFSGDPARAIEAARLQLSAQGFRIDLPNPTKLVATGPGMHSNQEDPIRGMTQAEIWVDEGRIRLAGELGGVARMKRFLYIFPFALGVGLALVFGVVSWTVHSFPGYVAFIPVLPVLPWIVLSPWMVNLMQKRAILAIDTLLHNMTIGL